MKSNHLTQNDPFAPIPGRESAPPPQKKIGLCQAHLHMGT